MTRYTATLEWSPPADGGRPLDQVVHELAEHSAHAATAVDGRAGLALTVEAEDIRAAAALAVDLATASLGAGGGAPPQLTGLSVSTSAAGGTPELSTWVVPDVLRVPDIAKAAGVSRQRVQQWVHERDDFPAALITTSYGALYPKAAVERWLERPRQAGRRARSAAASTDEGAQG